MDPIALSIAATDIGTQAILKLADRLNEEQVFSSDKGSRNDSAEEIRRLLQRASPLVFKEGTCPSSANEYCAVVKEVAVSVSASIRNNSDLSRTLMSNWYHQAKAAALALSQASRKKSSPAVAENAVASLREDCVKAISLMGKVADHATAVRAPVAIRQAHYFITSVLERAQRFLDDTDDVFDKSSDQHPSTWIWDELEIGKFPVFWPVRSIAKLFAPGKTLPRVSVFPSTPKSSEVLFSAWAGLLDISFFYNKPRQDYEEAASQGLDQLLRLDSNDKSADIARSDLATYFFRHRYRWKNAPDDWGIWLVHQIVSRSDGMIVPYVSIRGEILPNIDDESEVEIVDRTDTPDSGGSQSVDIEFGVRRRKPGRIFFPPSTGVKLWGEEWAGLAKLQDESLGFARQKNWNQLLASGPLNTVSQEVRGLTEGPNGDAWFHEFVSKCRGDRSQWPLARRVLQLAGLSCFPKVDWETGIVVDATDISSVDQGVKKRLSRLQDAPSSKGIREIERFSWNQHAAEYTLHLPVHREFRKLSEAVRNRCSDLDIGLIEDLETLHHDVLTNSDRVIERLTHVFSHFQDLSLLEFDHDPRRVVQEELSQAIASLPLGLQIVPSGANDSFNPGSVASLMKVAYQFFPSSSAPPRKVVRVTKFGLLKDGKPLQHAEVIVSAGPEPEGYSAILQDLSSTGPWINREHLAALLRELPASELANVNDPEIRYSEIYLTLWPDHASLDEVEKARTDPVLRRIRDWFRKTVESRQLFRVLEPEKGEYVMDDKWELNRTYVEANPDEYVNANSVKAVQRPLLAFWRDHTRPKHPARIYVHQR